MSLHREAESAKEDLDLRQQQIAKIARTVASTDNFTDVLVAWKKRFDIIALNMKATHCTDKIAESLFFVGAAMAVDHLVILLAEAEQRKERP